MSWFSSKEITCKCEMCERELGQYEGERCDKCGRKLCRYCRHSLNYRTYCKHCYVRERNQQEDVFSYW